jgi:hypothetical protein
VRGASRSVRYRLPDDVMNREAFGRHRAKRDTAGR